MTGIQEGVCLSAPLKDKGGDVSRLGNLGPSWNSGRDWDKEEDRWEGGSPPQRGSGCSWPEGGVCCRHVRACARNATTDKARPGGGGGRGPGARAPPARGAAAGRGAARGADARAPGPRRRHFVSSAQWGRVTAERGSKAGKEGMSQAPEREDWAEAGSAGRLRPCHLDSSADPALSGRRGGGRGRGGSGPGRRHIDSYLVRVPFSDRSRRPPARSRRGLAPKATRCAPGC